MDVPSRRNSGLLQAAKSTPCRLPEVRSSAGITVQSTVPGITVLRMTTVWNASFSRSTSPICSQTRWMYWRSMLPFGRLGVPTQMSETSLDITASRTSLVARSRPAWRMSRTRSPIPSSTIVLFPAFTISTLEALTSTPVTWKPSRAKQAAETQPT